MTGRKRRGERRVPDAVRHFRDANASRTCRSAEPGPSRTPARVTAPALQRTASQELRAALRPGNAGSLTRLRVLDVEFAHLPGNDKIVVVEHQRARDAVFVEFEGHGI